MFCLGLACISYAPAISVRHHHAALVQEEFSHIPLFVSNKHPRRKSVPVTTWYHESQVSFPLR
jgi:hypothetical protein